MSCYKRRTLGYLNPNSAPELDHIADPSKDPFLKDNRGSGICLLRGLIERALTAVPPRAAGAVGVLVHAALSGAPSGP